MSPITTASGNSQAQPRTRPPAYWIFLPGIVVPVCCLYVLIPRALTGFWVVVGVSLLVLVPALAGPLCRAFHFNLAASVCGVVVLAFYWAIAFFFLITLWSASPMMFLYFWYLIIPPLAINLAATFSCARRVGFEWALTGVGVGFVCSVILLALAPRPRLSEPAWERPLDPTALSSEILTISKCTQEFAVSHSRSGFPESLQQLGPQGTSCLSEDLVATKQKGFTIVYEPGSKDESGRVPTYSIKASETAPKGKDTSSIFTDESGLIWTRYDGPHGKGIAILYPTGEYEFQKVLSCLFDATLTPGPWRIFAGQSESVISDRDIYLRRRLEEQLFVGNRELVTGGYSYEYSFLGARDGAIDGFTIQVRPERYGIVGVRSYLAIATIDASRQHTNVKVFATPQDRPATVNDPLALGSEVGLSLKLASTDN
jgi:hypothetical protein